MHSQGFTPLEPGALSTLAKEPTLSSALAQFGNFGTQPATEVDSVQSNPSAATPTTPPIELLWSDTAEPVAQPVETTLSKSPEQTPVTTSHLDALSSLVASRAEAQSNPAASVPSNTQPAAAEPAAPTDQSNTSLDFELETTMKRPVVRLQPMQQRPSAQQQQIPSRGRSGELPPPHQAEGSALSNKQHLIKGYQYQLGGLYDEAMQEYRFIIGKAPELLSEVVSNMRALLKIAPRYSAGYRVLGDAYMRQGEYLQAMEAYNKALAMAKKTKS